MKNKFCVGQQVINLDTRKLETVSKVLGKGYIEVKGGTKAERETNFQIQAVYLDRTNFFYHHSKWSVGLELANDGLRTYLMTLDDLEDCPDGRIKEEFLKPVLAKAAADIERGYAIMRTVEHNMSQWDGLDNGVPLTLDYHRPFLNPENVFGY